MASNKRRKTTIDPVFIMGAGVALVAIALIMLLVQSSGEIVPASIFAGPFGQISVAFITGLTTGGLSCLAVQGGLLASSLARQIEVDLLNQPKGQKEKRQPVPVTQPALPIALFLLAKLGAYTLLGALLGWLGSFLSLDPISRAILMIAIGVFMLGNALRMLNVHPIFRYFAIEPPKFLTRYIRRTAKNGTELATPLFLGALTVFIPCGVTQAMMGAALATGRVDLGAALMFAFTLGTSPVFFLVAYLAAKIGERLESFFMRFVAIAVLVLGLVTLNSGLNLIGSSLSFENLTRGLFSPASAMQSIAKDGELTLFVKNEGYFPQTLSAKANQPVALNLVTNRTYSCARDFVIPALSYYELLPDTGKVVVDIPAQAPGTRMFFTCSMGMYTGLIVFE
jgi:sulfite exporter TauE/SafE